MDPEQTLKDLEAFVTDRDYCHAVDSLTDYYTWRIEGGFEPQRGDARASMLSEKLSDELMRAQIIP